MSTVESPVPGVPLQSSDDARIAASLDNWKRKLLDLTKRNRALNFRLTKVSTLAVVDEQPAEVFRRLYLQGKPMRFRAAAEAPAAPAASAATATASSGDAGDGAAVAIDPATASVDGSGIGGSGIDGSDVDRSDIGGSIETGSMGSAGSIAPATPSPSIESPSIEATSTESRSVESPSTESPSTESHAIGSVSTESRSTGSVTTEIRSAASTATVTGDAAIGGEPAGAAPLDADALFEGGEEDAPAAAAAAFAPYEAGKLHERHRDDELQTAVTPEQLDKSLRRIDEQARETVEEQGVNALFLALGVLRYREPKEPDTDFRAPLLLLPVSLSRSSAAAGYVVRATDDDPIVNPTLVEYLKQPQFGIALPELPGEIGDDFDLQTYLQSATDAVSKQDGWTVTTEIYLGLFAFQKFVMYKDLEASAAALAAHRLIRQLVTRRGESLIGLPDDVREMELDAEFPPERTFQVVDADGSQLRAIAAVAREHDLVLEGPPGTGKSQTITNLIAQALGAGKSVLFVAEKMAALSVVHDRLVRAGLGDFCLELHSTKANKRAVLKEIARSLDATLQRPKAAESEAARLQAVRATLGAYADAVHTPYGPLGFTPYRGFGELAALRDAPRIKLERPVADVTREQLDAAVRDLDDAVKAVGEIGDPAAHPWRDSTRTLWSEDDADAARALLRDLQAAIDDTVRAGAEVSAAYGLPPARTLADARTAVHVAEVVGRSPGAPLGVLQSDAWNAPPQAAQELIERGRRVSELKKRVSERFTRDALEQEHAADVAFIEEKEGGFLRFLNFLNGRFRLIKKRWLAYHLPSYQASLLEQAQEMKRVDELRRERAWLSGRDDAARQLFGALWQGEATSWDALDGYVRWVVEFRGLAVAHRLEEKAAELAAQPHPDVSLATALKDASDRASNALDGLRKLAGFSADYLESSPLTDVADRARAMEAGLGLAPRWAAFELVRRKVAEGIAAEALAAANAGEVAWADLPRAFRRAFHQKWVSAAVQEREPLRAFSTLTHEQRVAEFRRLDEQVLAQNRDRLVAQLRDAVQRRLRDRDAAEAMPWLQGQMARQRAHAPLRTTMQRAGAAIRAIKPCFMMSPLTVAQLLDGGGPSFDLVIFDEASQLPAEDAVGAISRGHGLVVVGDPNQLPPTNFFSVMAGQAAAPLADDGTPLFEDSESILEEFMGAGVPRTRLKWHYRSTHESLITFSNVSFYDADLYTFPSVATDTHAQGLVFRHVPDGVYEGKGLNLVEARTVVDAVVRHAKESPELSLGVGTFNLRQQLAIQDELEARRRKDPTLEAFFSRARAEPFFVKNLENIQGDERDVIFLSVTYAKGRDGRLRYNFGPINGENGWRRLNVLTTRARRRMVVFSSMRGDEIAPAAATSRGPSLLREFLLYAERGQMDGVRVAADAAADSPFERQVFDELTRRGLTLQPQVGVAGYRIDMAVLDDELAGRYVCGIECDGVAYHASQTARDRDRLRQQVLEGRGWDIHHVWSTDWFKDREGQVERLLRLVEESRARARDESARESESAGTGTLDPSSIDPASGDSKSADGASVDGASTDGASVDRGSADGASVDGVSIDGTAVDRTSIDGIAADAASTNPASIDPASAERTAIDAAVGPIPGSRSSDAAPSLFPSIELKAEPYRMADARVRHRDADLGAAPLVHLFAAIDDVVAAEAPVHVDDLTQRVAAMWGLSRAGSRATRRIEAALADAERAGRVQLRGEFVWNAEGTFAVRTRAEARIPAERIPPEEYREAVVRVLRATGGLPRKELTAQVRSLLGFSRTGARLEEQIGAAIAALLAEGVAGEASTGIRLRE